MLRTMLHSKIYGVKVKDACVDYEGSITIDKDIMQAANILPHEQVHVLNVTNGKRFVTYAIEGFPGDFCVNGAAAKLVEIGDELIILTYVQSEGFVIPTIVRL